MSHSTRHLLCFVFLSCAACSTIPDTPPGKGPVDPAGSHLAPVGYPRWEYPPKAAMDKLNLTGVTNYPGNWGSPDPVTGMVVPIKN